MFDAPHQPFEPERDRWARKVLADATFRAAVCECLALSVEELGLSTPIERQGFDQICRDPTFRSRFDALVLATLEAGP